MLWDHCLISEELEYEIGGLGMEEDCLFGLLPLDY